MVCTDFGKLLNPSRDFDAAVKEICRFCEFFLEHGPSTADRVDEGPTVRAIRTGSCSKDVSVEAVNMYAACLAAGAARSIWRDTAPLWYWAPKRPCSP